MGDIKQGKVRDITLMEAAAQEGIELAREELKIIHSRQTYPLF